MDPKTDNLAVLTGSDQDRNRPPAMNGTISIYPPRNKKVDPAELEKAENELRKRTKDLYKGIEENYWDLGQCLYEVYDGVPGGYRELMRGDSSQGTRKALFDKWGYKSFQDYCENEIGIMKRSAENLRYAYYWFEIKLNLPKEVRDQVKALGRSKVYQLSGIAESDSVLSWIEKARGMTHDELKKTVKQFKKKNGEGNKDDEERDQNGGSKSSSEGGEEDGDAKAAPAPEETHQLSTSLYTGQFETWNSAFERAKGISGSEKIGHNLELICQDFLTNNDFGKSKGDDLVALIKKFEGAIRKLVIVVDPASGRPLYGTDLLWKLVQERVKTENREKQEAADRQDPSNPNNVLDLRPKVRKAPAPGSEPGTSD